jgi:hypothetical protein
MKKSVRVQTVVKSSSLSLGAFVKPAMKYDKV